MQSGFSIKTFAVLLVLSFVFLIPGVGIPMHFRAVSPLLLEKAGQGTRSVETVVSDYVLSGKCGPVRLFWESKLAKPDEPERLALVDLRSRKPLYCLSGGPAPYFESFLSDISASPEEGGDSLVIGLFLPEVARQIALKQLSDGSNVVVEELLKARRISGWRRFIPATEVGGQPLDASILTLAMLARSDLLRPEFARAIPAMAEGAVSGDFSEKNRLEDVFLATLAFGRRMDWTQLSEFVRRVKTPEDLTDAATRIVRMTPDDFAVIYAATILCDDYDRVREYLSKQSGSEGMGALRKAVNCGQGALDVLFEKGEAMYVAPVIVRAAERYLSWMRPDALVFLALHHPRFSLAAKNLLIFASGLSLAMAAGGLWLAFLPIPAPLRKRNGMLLRIGNLFVAGAFTIAIWLVIEPNLLRFSTERPARAVFEISAGIVNNASLQGMNPNSLDQASVLSLLFFFFVQLAIYVFCVIRIRRLKTVAVSAKVKLTLLENEDNLFDLGLYIGLFGTVGSLLMIAMGIIQASLVAAYSSTLFGILFTALLKVVHIRVLRRDLIIESSRSEDAGLSGKQAKA